MLVTVSFKKEEYAAWNLPRVTLGMLNFRFSEQQGILVTAGLVG